MPQTMSQKRTHTERVRTTACKIPTLLGIAATYKRKLFRLFCLLDVLVVTHLFAFSSHICGVCVYAKVGESRIYIFRAFCGETEENTKNCLHLPTRTTK